MTDLLAELRAVQAKKLNRSWSMRFRNSYRGYRGAGIGRFQSFLAALLMAR